MLENIIASLAMQVGGVIDTLIPVGEWMAYLAIGVSLIWMALSYYQSGIILPHLLGSFTTATITLYFIKGWGPLVQTIHSSAREAIGLVLNADYSGPSILFTSAAKVAGRLEMTNVAFDFTNWTGSIAAGMVSGFIPVLVFLGMIAAGLLAVLAEVQLLLGAAVAPMILPFLAMDSTYGMGFGVIRYMVMAFVRMIVMGAMSSIIQRAVEANVTLAGSSQSMTNDQVWILLGVSFLMFLAAIFAYAIAEELVGGGLSASGYHAFNQHAGPAASPSAAYHWAASPVSSAAGSIANAGRGGSSATGGGAYSAGFSGSGGGSVPRSSGSGNAFAASGSSP